MPYQRSITLLDNGAVVAECGPMRITVFASVGRVPQRDMAIKAARESFTYLERVARLRHILSRRWPGVPADIGDTLAMTMVRSVLTIGDDDLTPMASVAGTIGDAVADYLYCRGMTKVVVDNGGDVTARLKGEGTVRVGIRPEVGRGEISHILDLDSSCASWGIATSGLGGRSFTRGIASAATVLARRASMADAAATAIANASFIEDANVIQRPAKEIDPYTDIPGLSVTLKVGPLSEGKRRLAIERALQKAGHLAREGMIFGAFVAVGGEFAMTDFLKERVFETAALHRPGSSLL